MRDRTLIAVLQRQAKAQPEGTAFVFGGTAVFYGDLWRDVRRTAAGLVAAGVRRGDRVALSIPNGPGFFHAFYGAILAGGIAVPLFHESGAERIARIASLCEARVVILPDDAPTGKVAGVETLIGDQDRQLFLLSALTRETEQAEFPEIDPDDPAFLQYTSGSTGDPKGVILTHRTLITNVHQMMVGMELSAEDIFVSWLPCYHDMGLILMTMAPFILGTKLVLLPTSLAKVKNWLKTIEEHKGTFTAAPDFAYRLCPRYIRDPASLDLSSLRMCLNAAEPVRAKTLEAFETMFGLGHVSAPAYGLAEATVGVSTWPPRTPPKVDDKGLVSVGKPFPEVQIRITDDTGSVLPVGEVGHIEIASPANCKGYWNNPQRSNELFREDGFLDSGDLGYVDQDGDLFITGRQKNVIISAGRTIAPQELEETVDEHPDVKISAALGIDRGEGEMVYLFAELRRASKLSQDQLEDIQIDLVNRIKDRLGFRPGRVYLVSGGTIPRTSNGKLQHALLKQRYLDGSLKQARSIVFPSY